jgi:peptidoglycan hydrolase-like protein with peptidoglycan-binding domain
MSSDRTLKRGLIGVDVLGLQKKLSHLGYYKGVHDGVFGSGTRAAVLSFQKDNNLPQDAEMDTNDQKVLDAKFTQTLQTQDPQLERAIEELKKILSNGR